MYLGSVTRFWNCLHYLDELRGGRDAEAWLEHEYETYTLLGELAGGRKSSPAGPTT